MDPSRRGRYPDSHAGPILFVALPAPILAFLPRVRRGVNNAHTDRSGDRIASVVLVPASGKLGALDYRIPPHLSSLQPGTRVLVPLGSRRCMGIVTAVTAESNLAAERVRDLIDVIDPTPILAPPLLRLVNWIADYYLATLSEALETALPGSLRIETEKIVSMLSDPAPSARLKPGDAAVLETIRTSQPISVGEVEKLHGDTAAAAVQRLRRRKLVAATERFVREAAPTKHEVSYQALELADPELLKRRPALRKLHDYLRQHPSRLVPVAELRSTFPNAAGKLRQLRDLNLVRQHRREVYRETSMLAPVADSQVSLNPSQQTAVDAIHKDMPAGFAPTLLLGVTGSGKTEVYLRAIAEVLEAGKTALVLVPEISLTHMLVARVRARFGDHIAVLHSGLGVGERWDEWRRLARGEARIAIGARSAVFAPLPDLGIIIVDEEHDGAYKQADGVRYHGRDVAVMRAKLEGCTLLLGSATAAIESFHNAKSERYQWLRLPERVAERAMPEVELVDLRGEKLDSPIGPRLAAALSANLAAGHQSLLFLNRRGFANALQCGACGDAIQCPNCSIALTWHQRARALRCHYCDYTTPRPERCPVCEQTALDTWGWGTERLEEQLRSDYPGARIARMDRDTTRRKGSMAELLGKWNSGKLDILIGTQMVTKGHDVAGVTLVGVVMADLTLNLPDFRSAERAFQQFAQVAGRAGRGDLPGRVLIQTLQPDHHVLRAVVEHDFLNFAEHEIEQREELSYPPFGRLVLVRVEGEDVDQTHRHAGTCASALRERAAPGISVLGPAPAPIARLRGRYRWQILLRGRNGKALRNLAALARSGPRPPRDIRLTIDVDPQSLL